MSEQRLRRIEGKLDRLLDTEQERKLLTVQEAADYFRRHRSTIYVMIDDGRIPPEAVVSVPADGDLHSHHNYLIDVNRVLAHWERGRAGRPPEDSEVAV